MRLLCMSFDGEYKLEIPVFKEVNEVWKYSSDIGSKWYFYPFHFVVTDSGRTIVDSPRFLEELNGRRVKTVSKWFNLMSKKEEAQGMDCDAFTFLLMEYLCGGI